MFLICGCVRAVLLSGWKEGADPQLWNARRWTHKDGPDPRDSLHWTPLHLAVKKATVSRSVQLLAHCVERQAQVDSFAALLAHKADINAVTNVGKGVLHLAVQYGSIACADKCILQNVPVNTLVPNNPHTHTGSLTAITHCAHSLLSLRLLTALTALPHCALCTASLRLL